MKNYCALICLVPLILLAACAPGGGSSTADDPAGFFMGIWHGWIAPISLICQWAWPCWITGAAKPSSEDTSPTIAGTSVRISRAIRTRTSN